MKRPPAIALLAIHSLLLTAAPAAATILTYTVAMDGAQVVPSGTGDPDGTANGTISLDDVTGDITFSFFYANIADPGSMHIHPGAAGVEGNVLVTLPVSIGVDPNPLVGTVRPFLATVQSIIANPTAFYVDIHTPGFTGGAVRGQIPEPTTALLLAAGLVALGSGRRRITTPAPPRPLPGHLHGG